jgi:glutamate carboxypeptidase
MSYHAALHDAINSRRDEMIEALRELVVHESPSNNKAALDALAVKLAASFEAVGGNVVLHENAAGGLHLRAQFGESTVLKPTLLVGHYDTVWPIGTLATMPFLIEGNRLAGPGCFDMKASLIMIITAIDVIQSLGLKLPRPIVVLITSDEETGSFTSRELIESEARACSHALIVEPPLTDGGLKTARKGTGIFQVNVEGRAAHAGVEPEKGRSAIVELAHQILAIQAISRPELGTTMNVGEIRGGTATNVVPANATAIVDARINSMVEAARVETEMRALQPVTPDCKLTITGRIKRPPMERNAAVVSLFERVRPIGKALGLELTEGSTGGASDGNFTAALGVATLDGLGCPGGGAHASHEHILIDGLIERTTLLAAILYEI